jgi:hypothetical protein
MCLLVVSDSRIPSESFDMSITFSLPSNETAYPSCPNCGGRINWDPKPKSDCIDPVCAGYGPDTIDSSPSLNLANANAMVMLRDVLGYHDPDSCGSLDPQDILLRLSMSVYRAPNAVRPTVQEGNVVSCGLSLERINGYCRRLGTLAELAIRRREEINYG